MWLYVWVVVFQITFYKFPLVSNLSYPWNQSFSKNHVLREEIWKVASVGFSLSKLLLSWKLIAIGVDLLIKPQLLQNKIVLLQKVFLLIISVNRNESICFIKWQLKMGVVHF